MREIPILFSDEMVRAILDGRKTQTRRPVATHRTLRESFSELGYYGFLEGKGHCFGESEYPDEGTVGVDCPLGAPGDMLWVRECWCPGRGLAYVASPKILMAPAGAALAPGIIYRADGAQLPPGTRWRPSIHMPRWAARIFPRVTDVRIERVQDITEEDARAEGHRDRDGAISDFGAEFARPWFRGLWDAIYAPRGLGWDANPWAWVVTFEPVEVEHG